jgi:hypothetical protein
MNNERIIEAVQGYIEERGCDLLVFSGPMNPDVVDEFIDLVNMIEGHKECASVFLTTYGGNPHAAYRMAKTLKRRYKRIRLLLAGPCKSAGTLVALGVHELAFGPNGELGPLDTQVAKPDELLPMNSVLDILQALSIATQHAYKCFEENMLTIIENSSGSISTKTSAEIATQLVVGLFSPIMAQIDPVRLGEVQRAISIAKSYAEQLKMPNVKPNTLTHIVEDYPSHAFVIDMEATKELFKNVESFSEKESAIASIFDQQIRYPAAKHKIVNLGAIFKRPQTENTNEQQTEGDLENTEPVQPGEQGATPAQVGQAGQETNGNRTTAAAQGSRNG